MQITVLGYPKSGKGSVAIAIALVLAELRRRVAAKGKRSQIKAPITLADVHDLKIRGVVTDAHAALGMRLWGVDPIRTISLAGVSRAIAAGSVGSPVVLNSATRTYERAMEGWQEQSGTARREQGLTPSARLGPEAFQFINRRMRESTYEVASRAGVDLIEVHRQGAGYMKDPDGLGLVETDGVQARGQNQAGQGSHLWILVDGGARSRRYMLSRSLVVASDASGLATSAERPLPVFRLSDPVMGRRDEGQAALVRTVAEILTPSLLWLIEVGDEERAAWESMVSAEAEDDWPEAREMAAAAEVARHIDTIKLSAFRYGLEGQSAEDRAARVESFRTIFGVSSPDLLAQIPLETLRKGVPQIEAAFAAISHERAEKATLCAEIRGEVERRGLGGKRDAQKSIVSRVLFDVVQVSTLADLDLVPLQDLRRAAEVVPGMLENLGYPVQKEEKNGDA